MEESKTMSSQSGYKPPRGDGEILIERAGIRAYREADPALERLTLGGVGWPELREELLSSLPGEKGQAIAAGGHQPVLGYPGITFKNIVHSRLAEARGLRPVNFVVDYDLPGGEAICYPALTERGYERRLLRPGFETGVSFEEALPDQQLAVSLESLLGAPFIDQAGLREFRGALRQGAVAESNLAGQLSFARRAWEKSWGLELLDVPFSKLCAGRAFISFFREIAGRASDFRTIYNRLLLEHRARLGGLRFFAELAEDKGRVELPFWCALAGRETLWIDKGGELYAGGKQVGELAAGNGELDLRLRPKALMLTMFIRLLVGEFFVHGTGGGNYEPLNDLLFEGFFGLRGGEYWVCSATLFVRDLSAVTSAIAPLSACQQTSRGAKEEASREVEGSERTVGLAAEELRMRLRRMGNNPEDFLGEDATAEMRQLAEEKRRLLEQLAEGGTKGRSLYRETRRITERLGDCLEEKRRELEAKLAGVDSHREGLEVLRYRNYPSFYYSAGRFEELGEKAGQRLARIGV